MNPAPAAWATSSEANVVPPGLHECVVHGSAEGFQTEVHGVQLLSAVGMTARRIDVNDVSGCAPLRSAESIDRVHLPKLIGT